MTTSVQLARPSEHDWLPLLRGVSQRCPGWSVWKNADAALEGRGDIDSLAPQTEWTEVLDCFLGWAAAVNLDTVIECRHFPQTMVLLALNSHGTRRPIAELDVCAEVAFRFARLFRADEVEPLVSFDARGFRRIRTGAEGFLLFLLHGIGRGGRLDRRRLDSETALKLVADDPEGARLASQHLGILAGHGLRAADSAASGARWAASAALLEAGSLILALKRPHMLFSRAWFRFVGQKRCRVARAVLSGRQMPDDRSAWVRDIEKTHRVFRPRTQAS